MTRPVEGCQTEIPWYGTRTKSHKDMNNIPNPLVGVGLCEWIEGFIAKIMLNVQLQEIGIGRSMVLDAYLPWITLCGIFSQFFKRFLKFFLLTYYVYSILTGSLVNMVELQRLWGLKYKEAGFMYLAS